MSLDIVLFGAALLVAALRLFRPKTTVRLDLFGLLDVVFALVLHICLPCGSLSVAHKTHDPRNSSPVPEYVAPRLIAGTEQLSEQLAAGSAQPPGGAVAALVAGWAASLAAAAADRSRPEWEEAGGARAQAQALRTRALALAQRGAEAHAEALESLLAARSAAKAAPAETRDWQLRIAVEESAQAPLELAACGLDIAELAQLIATHAAGDVRADAAVAAQLAAAAARAGAHLVEVNLVVGGQHEPAARARDLARAAQDAAARASELD
jgi:formiminotetrahydrofolate cyclodeaminase